MAGYDRNYHNGSVLESVIGRILVGIFPNMVRNIDSIREVNGMFGIAILTSILLGAVYFFICKYLMENRLNLN